MYNEKSLAQVMRRYSQLCAWQPPGFGGIERVAHELALFLAKKQLYNYTYYLRRSTSAVKADESKQNTQNKSLLLGNLPILNHRTTCKLLNSEDTVIFHIPSVPIFIIMVAHALIAPQAKRYVYWHAFLGYPKNLILDKLARFYERIVFAFCAITNTSLITTSPILANEIRLQNSRLDVHIVSPVLPREAELKANNQKLTRPKRQAIGKTYRICYVGRLATYKRPEWLIDVLPKLPVEIILEIVGDGPCRKSLEKKVRDNGLESRVTFHGRIDDETKLRIIADSDVLCLPSYSCNEAFGIVQLEAMCMGVPPLAFSLERSGVEWVGNIKSLLPFDGINRDNIRDVIIYLHEHHSLQGQISSYSLTRYRELFCREAWKKCLQFLIVEPQPGIQQ